jgi:hypothetical protein
MEGARMTMTTEERRVMLQGVMRTSQRAAATIIALGEAHGSTLLHLYAGGVAVEPLAVPDGLDLNTVLAGRLRAMDSWAYVYINEAWTTDQLRPFVTGAVTRVIDLPREDRREELIMVGVLKGEAPLVLAAPIEATADGRLLGIWTAREPHLVLGDASILPDW